MDCEEIAEERILNHKIPILLVEDDEIDVELVKRGFVKHGIVNPLHVVGDGASALALLGESTNEKFLILLDINLPGMNGLELLNKIRESPKLRDSVVFILSTSARPEDTKAAYSMNVAGYIVKGEVGKNAVKLCELLVKYLETVTLE